MTPTDAIAAAEAEAKTLARRQRRRVAANLAVRVGGVAAALILWSLLTPPDHPFWPRPQAVWAAAERLHASGELWRDFSASAWRVAGGVALAGAGALALALVGAMIPWLDEALDGVFALFRAVPPIALTPLAIVLFGVGDKPAMAIVAFGSFFPIWLGLRQGKQAVRADHLRAARSLGASRWMVATDVVLPSIAPYARHGLRIGVGLGWFSVVAAEMMGAGDGLGYGVNAFGLNLQTEACFLYILVIGLSGLACDTLLAAPRPAPA